MKQPNYNQYNNDINHSEFDYLREEDSDCQCVEVPCIDHDCQCKKCHRGLR